MNSDEWREWHEKMERRERRHFIHMMIVTVIGIVAGRLIFTLWIEPRFFTPLGLQPKSAAVPAAPVGIYKLRDAKQRDRDYGQGELCVC